MSLLNISTNQITFQSNDSFKTVTLTNLGESQKTRRPLMYKIKTNKIDYVDAKPSCGYISALKGQNEISILIRSLTSQKQYTAKLQILYVSHQKITEQLVQKSKRQFDMIEYNEIYDSIKNSSQTNVKTAIVNVTKKASNSILTATDKSQPTNVSAYDSQFSSIKLEQSSSAGTGESKKKEKQSGRYESFPKDKKKASQSGGYSCSFSFCLLLIGLLVGLFVGVRYAQRVSDVIDSVPVLSQLRGRLALIGKISPQKENKVQQVLIQQHQSKNVVADEAEKDVSQQILLKSSEEQEQQKQPVKQENPQELNKVIVVTQTITIKQTENQQQKQSQQTHDDNL